MRRNIFLLISLFLFQLSANGSDSLFTKVQQKLIEDSETFNCFKELYVAYYEDKKANLEIRNETYDSLYIIYYNKGLPLVRLIKRESLDSFFSLLYLKKSIFKKRSFKREYNNLIASYSNFNADNDIGAKGSQKEYFLMYLDHYYIIPKSH